MRWRVGSLSRGCDLSAPLKSCFSEQVKITPARSWGLVIASQLSDQVNGVGLRDVQAGEPTESSGLVSSLMHGHRSSGRPTQ